MREIRASGGSWVDRHFNCMAHLPSLSDYFGFNTTSSYITLSSQLEILFSLLWTGLSSFFPVYLYSSAYRLIINTPTRRYAGCSRGCPAAFKHGFHLALVPESQHQKIRVNMWMSTGCVHQQSFQRNSPLWRICKSITFHSKDTNTTITCDSLKKTKNYIPALGGTDTEKVSSLPIFSNTYDPAGH